MKVTQIKQQVKWPDRYSVYVDGVFAFGLSEAGLLQSGINLGMELDKAQLTTLKDTAANDKVYGNALRYVVMRPRSEWELRTYLKRKQADEPIIDQVVEKLRHLNLVDDLAFAKSWVANRRVLKSTSKRRLVLELKQKHVASAIIDQVLMEDETDEQQVLRDLIAKKSGRYPETAKLMQYLARQGFGYDQIRQALDETVET